MKTIRQLSSEIGISKEAIYKKLKYQLKNELENHITKLDGVTHIDGEGERLIIQSLRMERQEALQGVLEIEPYDNVSGAPEPTRELITTLTEQIKTKDEQLETQSEHIGLLIRQLGNSQLLTQAERIRGLLAATGGTVKAGRGVGQKSFWRRVLRK